VPPLRGNGYIAKARRPSEGRKGLIISHLRRQIWHGFCSISSDEWSLAMD
jgi:hypothetical protein